MLSSLKPPAFGGKVGNQQQPKPELGHMVSHPPAGVKHKLTASDFRNLSL